MPGRTAKREEDVSTLLTAGANLITKYPVMNKFGSKEAKEVEETVSTYDVAELLEKAVIGEGKESAA